MMVLNPGAVLGITLRPDVLDDAGTAHKVLELGKEEMLAHPLPRELWILQSLLVRYPLGPELHRLLCTVIYSGFTLCGSGSKATEIKIASLGI